MDSRLRGSKSGEGEGIREGRATTRVAPTRDEGSESLGGDGRLTSRPYEMQMMGRLFCEDGGERMGGGG